MQFVDKMKKRWGVGPFGVVAILAAFSLAGMTVVRIRGPVMNRVLPEGAPTWAGWVAYLLLLFPLYQVCLLGYGTIFGQFRFFWGRYKALGRLFARLFHSRQDTAHPSN